MTALASANVKELSPMRNAIQHSDYLGNRMVFRFKKWFNFGTVSEEKTCEYMVSRFISLEKSGTKGAAQKAVECAEFALELRKFLIKTESSRTEVQLISPLEPEFYARIAAQCAKAASPKSEKLNFFSARAKEYNEMAVEEYAKKKEGAKVAGQLAEAVKNYGTYVVGLEKLSQREDIPGTIFTTIDRAKESLADLKKKLALAEAEEILSGEVVAHDDCGKAEKHSKAAWKFFEGGNIEDAVRHLAEAARQFIQLRDIEDVARNKEMSSMYDKRAVDALEQAKTWAAMTGAPGSDKRDEMDAIIDNVRFVRVIVKDMLG